MIKRFHILLIASFIIGIFLISGCGQMEYIVTYDMMDTFVTINVIADNQKSAEEAITKAVSEIERVEQKFTAYKESLVYDLNKDQEIAYDSELAYIIEKSIYYSNITGGAFDITVQPVLDLYTTSFAVNHTAPTGDQIERVLSHVGSDRITFSDGKIKIYDTKLTFGGIAKGYAIDRAVMVLQEEGITAALVNAGGDVRGYGKKPDGSLWKIALQDPDGIDDHIAVFEIRDNAVATSGNYERYYDENRTFHHIVDPRTGYSAQGLISASVVAGTAMEADALATSFFVLGKEDGLSLIDDLPDTEALVITEDNNITYSRALTRHLSLDP